jgi:hypothetical protein
VEYSVPMITHAELSLAVKIAPLTISVTGTVPLLVGPSLLYMNKA